MGFILLSLSFDLELSMVLLLTIRLVVLYVSFTLLLLSDLCLKLRELKLKLVFSHRLQLLGAFSNRLLIISLSEFIVVAHDKLRDDALTIS